MPVFSRESHSHVEHNAEDVMMPQPRLTKVPFLWTLSSWALVCRQADEYMYPCYRIPVPTHVSDAPALVPSTLPVLVKIYPSIFAAPVDPPNTTVPKEPHLREVYSPVSTTEAVRMYTAGVAPSLASSAQPRFFCPAFRWFDSSSASFIDPGHCSCEFR